MRGKHQSFNFERSLSRINEILNTPTSYDEANDIPKREDLRFKNGKYVQCASLFIDLRGSSKLIEVYKKQPRTLARLYRAYISEMVAIVNSFKSCKEVNIVGDCVSAVFAGNDGEDKPVIEALKAAGVLNGMMQVLNVNFKKKWGRDFDDVKAGIGVAVGRALVIKAGHSGTGISDLVYMGDVVNRASKMCGLAYKEFKEAICVTEDVYNAAKGFEANEDTKETFQDFFSMEFSADQGFVYTSSYLLVELLKWAEDNK